MGVPFHEGVYASYVCYIYDNFCSNQSWILFYWKDFKQSCLGIDIGTIKNNNEIIIRHQLSHTLIVSYFIIIIITAL